MNFALRTPKELFLTLRLRIATFYSGCKPAASAPRSRGPLTKLGQGASVPLNLLDLLSGFPNSCPNEGAGLVHDFGSILNFIECAFGTNGNFLSFPSHQNLGISPSYPYADVEARDSWLWGKRQQQLPKGDLPLFPLGLLQREFFDGPVSERSESRHGERRTFAIGLMEEIEIVVVYVMRGKRRRIISQGAHIAMKGKSTRTASKMLANGETDFRRLRETSDEEIDYSDIPKLDKSFWKNAKLTMPTPKDRLTIRVDHDVVEWLKKKGSGYQTLINAILRSYMQVQLDEGADRRT